MPIPQLPAYAFLHLNYIKDDMMEISGLRETSMGRPPKGMRSGVAIAQLIDLDDSTLGPMRNYFKFRLEEVGNIAVSVMRNHYTEKRMIRLVGDTKIDYIKDFLGSDMAKGENVYCMVGTGLPTNMIAREEVLRGRFKDQIITKEEVRQSLEMNKDEMFSKERLDERIANIENGDMARGVIHTVEAWQNHLIHIIQHNQYRNTTGYKELPDIVKQVFDLHCEAHDEAMRNNDMTPDVALEIQKKAGPNMAVGAAAAGQMAQAGGPSPLPGPPGA